VIFDFDFKIILFTILMLLIIKKSA